MRESAHLGKHAHLVAEVETRSGLVHHEERGLLHKRAGDEDHLALASRYLGVIAIAQVGDAELFEQRVGLGVSVLRRAREHIRPGDGAHHHHVDDEERKRRLVNLGDVADKRGHALSVALIDEPPVDVEPSRREGNEPEQRFEQRRHDHAAENEHQNGVFTAADALADEVRDTDRRDAEHEGVQLDEHVGKRQQDGDGGAEARAG